MILRLWRILIAWLRWKLSTRRDTATLHADRMESLERAHAAELREFDEELKPALPHARLSMSDRAPSEHAALWNELIVAAQRNQTQAMNAGMAQYGSQGSQLQNMLASAQYRLDSSATSNLSASQLQNSQNYWGQKGICSYIEPPPIPTHIAALANLTKELQK